MNSRHLALIVLGAAAIFGGIAALAVGSLGNDGEADDGGQAAPVTPPTLLTSTTSAPVPADSTPEFLRSNEPCPPGLPELAPDSDPAFEGARLEVAADLPMATRLAFIDAGHAFVGLRTGQIHSWGPDGVSPTPVIDLSDDTAAEHDQGLVGLVLDPGGEWLYVNHTAADGDSVIRAFPLDGTEIVDANADEVLLEIDQPSPQHNGGSMVFDAAGHMYVSFGDGGGQGDPFGNGQDLSTSLGAILRFIPQPDTDEPVGVPDDNPFVDDGTVAPLIWAYGVRNPFTLAFDQQSGSLWVGDVGQQCLEEISVLTEDDAGANLGWNVHEGSRDFLGDPLPDHHEPLFDYKHGRGRCSIIAGATYRGDAHPEIDGQFLFSDLCGGELFALDPDTAQVRQLGPAETGRPVEVAISPDGEIYVVDIEVGVLRFTRG